MWKRKKFMVIALLAVVLIAGSISGAALAQDDEEEVVCEPGVGHGLMLDRVCEIYEAETGVSIEQTQLQNAFTQAMTERQEEALTQRLQNMVENGRMTQEQADQFAEWQKSKPEFAPGAGSGMMGGDFGKRFGGHPMERGFGGVSQCPVDAQ